MKNERGAVFVDRDGTLNEVVYHHELGVIDTPFTVRQFRLLPGASRAVKALNTAGIPVFLASNQPGPAKGRFTLKVFEGIARKMRAELRKGGARLDGEYYCLHHPDARVKAYRRKCTCRKPGPGMLLEAARENKLDLGRSWMVGDGMADVKAGRAAGCRTILLGNLKCDLCRLLDREGARPDFIVPNLFNAVDIILEEMSGKRAKGE